MNLLPKEYWKTLLNIDEKENLRITHKGVSQSIDEKDLINIYGMCLIIGISLHLTQLINRFADWYATQ